MKPPVVFPSHDRYTRNNGFDLVDYQRLLAEYMPNSTRESRKPIACALSFSDTLVTDTTTPQAASLELIYYCQDETLPTSDSDTSVWFDDGFDYIRAGAQLLYAQFNEGNVDMPATELQAFKKRLDDMQMFYIGTGQQ